MARKEVSVKLPMPHSRFAGFVNVTVHFTSSRLRATILVSSNGVVGTELPFVEFAHFEYMFRCLLQGCSPMQSRRQAPVEPEVAGYQDTNHLTDALDILGVSPMEMEQHRLDALAAHKFQGE